MLLTFAEHIVEEKRDFIAQKACNGAEVSLRRPTIPQERDGEKRRRPAPFEMTVGRGLPAARMRRLLGTNVGQVSY